MQKTIKGIATVNSKEVEFELIEDILHIYYKPDDGAFVTTALLDDEGKTVFRSNESIKEKIIYGLTTDSKKIAFKVSTSYVRFFTFEVVCNLECYYILNSERFDCINIISSDIHAVTSDYEKHSINPNDKGIEISFEGKKKFFCTKLADDSEIRFACYETYKTKSKDKNPIEYIGQIQIVFDSTDSIDRAFQLIELARSFITYLSFRRDIVFDEIFLGVFDEESLKFSSNGVYFSLNNPDRISNLNLLSKRRISFYSIEVIVPQLIESISKNTIYLEHMRNGLTNKRLISGGDIVTLTAGFEFEFDKSGIVVEKKKSEQEQIEYLKKRYNRILKSDKIKSYGRSTVKNAIKHIDDLLLESKLNSFFKVLPSYFIEKLVRVYVTNGISFKPSQTSKNISTARNKIAHGDLDYQITQDVLIDFLVLEIIMYFIQFKRLGLDDLTNYKCMIQLFDLRP